MDVEKRAAQRLLDNFEASIFFLTFQTPLIPLADSMEGPVKSREGVNTSMTMVDACVPSTLWRHSLSRHGLCRGGPSKSPEKGQHSHMPARHLTLWRSLDPVVVCLAGGAFLALLNVLYVFFFFFLQNHRRKNKDINQFRIKLTFSWSLQKEADRLRKSRESLVTSTKDKYARKL